MRIGFFTREALRSVSRNAVPSAAAIASVLVTVLVLGVFIPIVPATTGAANEVRGRVLVDVYLKKDARDADVERGALGGIGWVHGRDRRTGTTGPGGREVANLGFGALGRPAGEPDDGQRGESPGSSPPRPERGSHTTSGGSARTHFTMWLVLPH